jgi:hypothetical protein
MLWRIVSDGVGRRDSIYVLMIELKVLLNEPRPDSWELQQNPQNEPP